MTAYEDKIRLLQRKGIKIIDQLVRGKLEQGFPLDKIIDRLDLIQWSKVIPIVDMKISPSLAEQLIEKKYSKELKDLNMTAKELLDLNKNKIVSLDEIKKISAKIPIEEIPLNDSKNSSVLKSFIKKYGIDNIIKLEEESNGIFSKKLFKQTDSVETYLNFFALSDEKMKNNTNEKLDYETFKKRIRDILIYGQKNLSMYTNQDISDYGFIQGIFRKENADLFIDDSLPDIIKQKFYYGKLTAKDIKEYNLVEILEEKNLSCLINKKIYIKNKDEWSFTKEKEENIVEILVPILGKKEFLQLLKGYGNLIDSTKIIISKSKLTKEEILETIEETIYNKIKENSVENINSIKYYEDMPKIFKEKHPDLFIDETLDETIKKDFYEGTMTFEKVKNNPELVEKLKNIDLDVCFRKYQKRYKNENSPMYKSKCIKGYVEILGQEIFLKLIEKYGEYLVDVPPELLDKNLSSDETNKIIEQKIYDNIINRHTEYGEDAPEQIKKDHPELFLDENAPDLLKLSFYDKYSSDLEKYQGHLSSQYSISFKLIKENPEFKKILHGKNLTRAFPYKYEKIMGNFDENIILNIFINYSDKIEKIIQLKQEEQFKIWYDKKGEEILNHIELIGKIEVTQIDEFNLKEYEDIKNTNYFNISNNYRQEDANNFLSTMYALFGYNKTKELLKLPEISEEQLNRAVQEFGQAYNDLYVTNIELKGNIAILANLFNQYNLSEYPDKIKFNVYLSLNKKLEEGYNGSLEELLKTCITENGLEVETEKIKNISENSTREYNLQKMQKIDMFLNEKIEEIITAGGDNKKIIVDIIKSKLKKGLNNSEYSVQQLMEEITEEFKRTKKNEHTGEIESFYSPHITDKVNEIEKVFNQLLSDPKILQILNNTVVDVLKEEKLKIGQGWIRKILTIPKELNIEQAEYLQQKIYPNNPEYFEMEKKLELKDKSRNGQLKAVELFKKIGNKELLTYEKAEIMFGGITKPYSAEFILFFETHKKEILTNEECYINFSKMHNMFDEIISDPRINLRYKAGKYKLEELLDEIKNITYDNVKKGERELERVCKIAGLEKKYFPIAQKIFEILKKREYQTIPPANIQGKKFRGRILRADDPLTIVVGNRTSCCQQIGENQPGEASMIHSATEKNGGIFVIEELDVNGEPTGELFGQSWVWRNKDRMCFDNVEIDNGKLAKLSNEELEEIMQIYIQAGNQAINRDSKFMKKMLEEGQITQEQYDELVLKEITVGTGNNNLEPLVQEGRFKNAEHVKPKEHLKTYIGASNRNPYLDSRTSKIIAQMDEVQRKEIEERRKKREKNLNIDLEDVPLGYGKIREVLNLKGRDIDKDIVEDIIKIEQQAFKEERRLLQNDVITYQDIAKINELNPENMQVFISRDKEWYMIYEEREQEVEISDLAMVNSANGEKNGEVKTDIRIVGFEMAERIYSLMIQAAKKGKLIKFDATKDTSGINLERMIKKGFATIKESDETWQKQNEKSLEQKTVSIEINIEKLEQELERVKQTLEKVKEKQIMKGYKKPKEDKEEKGETDDR